MVCVPGGKGIGQYRHIKAGRSNLGDARREATRMAAQAHSKELHRTRASKLTARPNT
jgi:hypothetical protein